MLLERLWELWSCDVKVVVWYFVTTGAGVGCGGEIPLGREINVVGVGLAPGCGGGGGRGP
jgi:hypothetical protein